MTRLTESEIIFYKQNPKQRIDQQCWEYFITFTITTHKELVYIPGQRWCIKSQYIIQYLDDVVFDTLKKILHLTAT